MFQEMIERREIFLVFAMSDSEWRLQGRREIYVEEASPPASRLSRNEQPRTRLFETKMSNLVAESLRTKIQALRKFRPLLEELKRRVGSDLEAIRNAKKLTE